MFIHFFYTLRDTGIPVSPTSFLLLQRAMGEGLVNSLADLPPASWEPMSASSTASSITLAMSSVTFFESLARPSPYFSANLVHADSGRVVEDWRALAPVAGSAAAEELPPDAAPAIAAAIPAISATTGAR